MDQKQTVKRSFALPITLLLLVFSLIGNVFLYSQFLQNKQQNNYETGQQIYDAAVKSQQYFQEMIPQLDALLESEQAEERIEAKFLIGSIVQKGQGVVDLATYAEPFSTSTKEHTVDFVLAYINDAQKSLQAVGSHDGPLKAEEREYLEALKSSYEKMAEIMSQFSTNIKDNRVAIIRLSSGLDWSELVPQLQQVMSEQSPKLTAP